MALEHTKRTKKTADTGRQTKRLVYCGPNLPGGKLQAFSVFKGGLPAHVDALIADCPDVRALIVPVDRLSVVRSRLTDKTSAEFAMYAAVRKHFNV